ncbi:retinol dehydrogenase 11-like [Lineus longissimus]|uniref:retinol dehydrogenase 11-like n=1 Tax=Lineus longissimus TaxID=88925 RepID=UPI002B4F43A3
MLLYLAVGFLAVCLLIKLYILFTTAPCMSDADLTGKTVVITGATAGIGYETAMDLATRNANIILTARNLEKGNLVKDKIIEETGNRKITVKQLNLASLRSVRRFADEIKAERIDILINNAGTLEHYWRKTDDGFEMTWGVNFFGPFLLTNLLLDQLKKSSPSRIVNLTSIAHKWSELRIEDIKRERKVGSQADLEYMASKLAIVLFTKELNRKLEGTGVSVFVVHPGTVQSELFRSYPAWHPVCWILNVISFCFFKSAKDGAQTTLHCAVAENLEKHSGEYFDHCKPAMPNKIALDEGLAKKLWEFTEKEVGL